MSGSLLLCKDVANSKLRELEVDSSGLLKVDKVDVSALATESSLTALSAKVMSCDTNAVAVSSCALPTGASTSAIQTLGNTILSTLDGKVVACDTGAVVVSSSALPAGGASSAYQSLQISELQNCVGSLSNIDIGLQDSNSHLSSLESEVQSQSGSLSDLAGCVSAGVLQVSGGGDKSSLSDWVLGATDSTDSIADGATLASFSFDADNYDVVTIAGNSSNTNDSSLDIEVSMDNTIWFKLADKYLNVDWQSGDFGMTVEIATRYIRVKRSNTSGSTETIKALIAGKK